VFVDNLFVRLLLLILAFGVGVGVGAGVGIAERQAYRGCFDAENPAARVGETAPRVEAARVIVAPRALREIGIPLLRGRDVTAADTFGTAPVALVTESVAAALWPQRDPIGNRMHDCIAGRWVTIVGVVGNVLKNRSQPVHHVFVPFSQ
jgi:hypothetical protein